MTVIDELLENASAYAETFDKGGLALPPARRITIVACMDARLNPHALLGLREGDAHVIRNAGAVITDDEIRSLAISQRLLGTEEILLIHHTDCGMLTFKDDELRRQIQDETGVKPEWGGGGVRRSRRRRAPVGRTDQGEPVHPRKGQDPRLRVRRRDGPGAGGRMKENYPPYAVVATTHALTNRRG
jgi:hypothetical protein